MGYYTTYVLTWHPPKEEVEIVLEANKDTFHGINSDGSTSETVKWYDHEQDVLGLSKQFPDVLFTLSGEGEDSGDIWNKYFKNGKMQTCKAVITLEKFDPKKLK